MPSISSSPNARSRTRTRSRSSAAIWRACCGSNPNDLREGDTLMKRYGRSKSTMTGLVTVSGLLVGLNATPAAAQNAGANAESQQGVLQEVVVSARREAESVQDIPTSITAFTPEDQQQRFTDSQDAILRESLRRRA